MECKDHLMVYVKKEKSDGNLMVKKQCLSCGEPAPGMFKFTDIGGKHKIINLPDYSDELQEQYYKSQQLENQQKRDDQRNEWFIEYNKYLRSDKWKLKRQLVLKRDNNLCQACLTKKAEEIHHLSYNHVFNEPLFELISVCKRCHDKITELDRE